MNVAILGASNKPDRYSYKAIMLIKETGHTPYPVHPLLQHIEGIPVYPSLQQIPAPLDVVTVYIGLANQSRIENELLITRPQRVIFNPGAENPLLTEKLKASGIEAMDACTLILLKTGQL